MGIYLHTAKAALQVWILQLTYIFDVSLSGLKTFQLFLLFLDEFCLRTLPLSFPSLFIILYSSFLLGWARRHAIRVQELDR